MRVLSAVVGVAAAGLLVTLAVAGSNRLSGPVIMMIAGTHGVHRNDLVAVAAGVIVVAVIVGMARR